MLGNQANLGHGEPHIQIKWGGQGRRHIVANFIQKHESQH